MSDMDPEIAPLVDALNTLPGITTCGSCSGHGLGNMWVTFRVTHPADLVPLAHLIGDEWAVTLEPADDEDAYFCLEGPVGAYWVAGDMAEYISEWVEETTCES